MNYTRRLIMGACALTCVVGISAMQNSPKRAKRQSASVAQALFYRSPADDAALMDYDAEPVLGALENVEEEPKVRLKRRYSGETIDPDLFVEYVDGVEQCLRYIARPQVLMQQENVAPFLFDGSISALLDEELLNTALANLDLRDHMDTSRD